MQGLQGKGEVQIDSRLMLIMLGTFAIGMEYTTAITPLCGNRST